MATPNTPFIPSADSQAALISFAKQAGNLIYTQWNIRERMRNVDLAYIREQDKSLEQTKAKAANKYGDPSKYQNITVPVVMPQVESAVTYQASVFLTGQPIFGVAAPPEFVDAGVMLETIIEDEQIKGDWVRNLMLFFRDGAKYNLSAIEVNWHQMNTAQLETKLANGIKGTPVNKVWAGNTIRRLDPYNTFFDTRVSPSQVYCDGDYAGYHQLMSRIKLKKFINDLPVKINVTEALNSATTNVLTSETSPYFLPEINPEALTNFDRLQEMDWMQWASLAKAKTDINYKNNYLVTTIYARIIPSDFAMAVPERNTPQIFKIIVINNQVVIHVERQTNAHGWIPILIGVPNEDGLDFQTKSLADNATPFQQVATTMINSMIAGRRRAVNDRLLYDPSRVSEAQINNPNPIARIPVRPSAYGKPVSESVYAFPYRDESAGVVLQEIQTILALGNEVNGQNKARQGQFVKGNKTQSEFQTVMNNANGRDQMTSILYESQVFTPLKQIIKINILQYQGAEKIFSKSKNITVNVDPAALRDAIMDFKISDGLIPTDKLMDADSYTIALQTLGSSPQIAGGYNIAPLFSYLVKQRGADLTPFEKSPEQIAYEEAVMAWQQAVAAFAKGLEAGTVTQEQLPPQPTPEQYGYKPAGNGTASTQQQAPRVSNITNNITNNVTG